MALTVITLVFTPFTAISVMFGMNVRVPWKTEFVNGESNLAFFLLTVVCVIFSALFYGGFKLIK